jgi:hypothetical protein
MIRLPRPAIDAAAIAFSSNNQTKVLDRSVLGIGHVERITPKQTFAIAVAERSSPTDWMPPIEDRLQADGLVREKLIVLN